MESFGLGGKLINITKIKYINVLHKVYNVTDISFSDMIIKAVEADASIADIPDNEIYKLTELSEFCITLVNAGGLTKVIDFEAWKREHKKGEFSNG
jgi:hypothetical protein